MIEIKSLFALVIRALVRRGRTVHEAEDLVQEAWLRLARHPDPGSVVNPSAFLMRTALNLSIDAHRARVAQGEAVALDDVVLVDGTPGAEAQVLARERLVRLTSCLGRLPERTRDIFLAHRLDGRSYTDIAREHGISINAVERHVTKATLMLMGWMEGW